MGSTESKLAASASIKPKPAVKNSRVSHLIDPRSPSTGIDRTPIQVGYLTTTTPVWGREKNILTSNPFHSNFQVNGFVLKSVPEEKRECSLAFPDPRSPTVGITRTPVREIMSGNDSVKHGIWPGFSHLQKQAIHVLPFTLTATVGSFARRLGMLFHNETEGKAPETPQKHIYDAMEEALKGENLASTEPLLIPQPLGTFGSLAEHAKLLDTPEVPPVHSAGDVSPFLLLEEPQVEVELQTQADISLEEAEEARESPLHNRLSMSLITCHEGATSSQIFAEVHCDSTSSLEPGVEVEQLKDGVDHSYALPFITVETETPVEPSIPTDTDGSPAQVSHAQSEEAEQIPPSEESKELDEEMSLPPVPAPAEQQIVPSLEQPQLRTDFRCPTLDPRSPSQVVFKPQWLGKGFGTNGLRAKSVQGHCGKGGSSPLAIRVAKKNATNENKGQSGKRKQKGVCLYTKFMSPHL